MAEIITKERKAYRIFDKVNNVWNELKFLTSANSVDASDGNNLEHKVGAINGITSDLSGEADDIAASIACVKQLNDSLGELPKFQYDENGKIIGYTTEIGGADSVFPFSGGKEDTYSKSGNSVTYTFKNLIVGHTYRIIAFKAKGGTYGFSNDKVTGVSGVETLTSVRKYAAYDSATNNIYAHAIYTLVPSENEATVMFDFGKYLGAPEFVGIGEVIS